MPNLKKDKLRKQIQDMHKRGLNFTEIGRLLKISRQKAFYYKGKELSTDTPIAKL